MTDKANTPEEIVDVVNENDEIVDQSTKGEVNSNPSLIHREIGILIYNSQRKLLIQQRSRNKKTHPLFWTISVAGHIPRGMTPETAAHMELREELGVDAELVQYEKVLLRYPNETHFAYGYIGKIHPNAQVSINKDEIEDYRFINASDLEKMISNNEKIEEYSLLDFQKFFAGGFDKFIVS